MKRSLAVALSLALFPSMARSTETTPCGKLAEVPVPKVSFAPKSSGPLFRRLAPLLRSFSDGEGELTATGALSTGPFANGVALYPLPWNVAPGRADRLRLVTWQDRPAGDDENMPAIVLQPGESWCSASLALPRGARLRLEGISIGRAPGHFEIESSSAGKLYAAELPAPARLSSDRQMDLALEPGERSLCFRASGGPVALGEPRVLVPDDEENDPRPRWIVLTIVDALRGDELRREDASTIMPTLARLSEAGHHYERAVSPGCHTRASVWPILMGRDLMRIDPLQRRQSMPIQSPLEAIYSRANLFVSHFAEAAGYHSVFLGNNAYLRTIPAFARYSSWGKTDTGTFDTIQRLPDLLSRYADERVMLVYYVSTPHGQSETPLRLYRELGCASREGLEQCHCAYDARARHADEALEALEKGLQAEGLTKDVFTVVTADHGELFGDGMKILGELPTFATGEKRGAFQRFDLGHGNACHEEETDVPIVVSGKGVESAAWKGAVSGLDVFPTLLKEMGLETSSKLDGTVLPLSAGGQRATTVDRPFVSYGFCSDSRIEGNEQLVWWVQGCRLREEDGAPLERHAEIWSGGKRVATDLTAPERVRKLMRRHESWLRERLPSEAFVFGALGLEDATVVVRAEGGRIIDYGPSSSVDDLEDIEVLRVAPDGSEMSVRFQGYQGLYQVTTLPSRAKLRVEVEGNPHILTFAGPMQLPLSLSGQLIDPSKDQPFLFASKVPDERHTTEPALRLWWEGYGRANQETLAHELSDFDRVLREWGYIR